MVLTGIGGIGKTALAGRVISRLREDGWLIAVHEGRWNPTALIAAVAKRLPLAAAAGADPALARAPGLLADPDSTTGPSWRWSPGLLEPALLVVFDDFEQNLTTGGQEFLDPAVDEVITRWPTRPGPGRCWSPAGTRCPARTGSWPMSRVPPLSVAEMRRMFLRLPALADLMPEDQRLLTRIIGGHPRLIEFTDALLRRGRSSLGHVQVKLRELAASKNRPAPGPAGDPGDGPGDDPRQRRHPAGELLGLFTSRQAAILAQVAVCRAPMTHAHLALAQAPIPATSGSSGRTPTG